MDGEQTYIGTNRTLTGGWQKVASRDYSTFLTPHQFEWFATFTFATDIHPEAADKSFRHWLNLFNTIQFGKRWNQRSPFGVKWVRALEWQKRGVIHYHVLITGIPLNTVAQAQNAQTIWRDDMGCGFARIDLIKGEQTLVKNYLAKYVTKGGELDFSPNFASESRPDLAGGLSLNERLHKARQTGNVRYLLD